MSKYTAAMSASANNNLETQLDGVLKNILQICNRTYMHYDENTLDSSEYEIDVNVGNGKVVLCEAMTNFSHDSKSGFQKWNCTFLLGPRLFNAEGANDAVRAMDDVLHRYIWGDSEHPSKLHEDLRDIMLHAFQRQLSESRCSVHQAVFFMKDYCVWYTWTTYNDGHGNPLIVLEMCHIEFKHPHFIDSLKSVVSNHGGSQAVFETLCLT
jgi:hypothetical protein